MSKKFVKSAAWDFAAILPFFCFCSCIVDSYEWDEVDKSINIQTDVGVPIGSSELITIASLLSLESGSMLYEDADGNYSFSFASDPTLQTIQIHSFSLDGGEFIKNVDFNLTPINLKYKTNKKFPDLTVGSTLTEPVSVTVDDIIEGGSTSGSFSVSEEVSDLVKHIEEISYIYLDAAMNATFSVNLDNNNSDISLTGCKLTITLPDYMYISNNSGDLTIKENHIIELDKEGLTGNELEVSFQLDSMDMKALKDDSNGKSGYYVLSDDIPYLKIEGEVEISNLVLDFYIQEGTTFTDIPTNVNFSIDLEFEDFSVTGVEVRMCSDLEIDDVAFEPGSLFDFLYGDKNVIDLYNPVIFLNVANSTPVAASFYSKLQSSADNYDVEIEIGSKDEPIIFKSSDDGSPYTSTIYFSSKKEGVEMSSTSNYTENIVIENLSDIFSHLPDKVSISDISLSAYYEDEDDYTLIQFSKDTLTYGFEFSYGFDIPLAFDDGLSIFYTYDIAWLGELPDSEYENSEIYVNVASVKMTFVNAIPLQMSLTASALGTDGNILNDESLEIEISSSDGGKAIILGGTVDFPQESELLLILNAGGQVLDLDGFRLNITAGSSEELAGLQLNSSQYIQIKDIYLHFDGGIDVEL